MTERISTTAPTIGDKPWYHYPVGDIPDDTLRHIVSSFNERFNQAALSSRENYAANTFLPAYNKVVRAWEQEPNIYPTQLPVAEVPPYPATPHPSRIEFFRVVYDLLDRKPTCIEDHLNAELAAQRAIEWFVECKIPHVNGPEVSLEIKTWGADELYRHIWGADGEGPLGRLRSVVGKSVSIDGIEYKIHACFTATEDIDPVYELHAVDSPQDKRYVPLPELENLMGRIIL
ncbi:hypothetical protein PUNSTDRAFT_136593 [Punctularia strigosozonata HHB-11173 SS5]|uniref:uncharacterized protein n=1 Tax=Punctularia strigosozonata (strain HHB-11173) TaxID=741275 RepID=UPI0004417A0F|nr:uncharacterized protein PUNSTDRAFT_136593 [Punctularia strigosozonata HHB-11173 SS5]EIN06759.1 hypothetical protein PUNSTDRAFT_136593 [Punctularia strigosozonata HHB-11173 SS5]